MRYSIFRYLIGEGCQNALKNKKSTTSCLFSMIGSMILFGLFFALMINTNYFLKKVESDQGISVFIEDTAKIEDKDELENKIRAIDGVADIKYKTKEQALQSVKEQYNNEKYKGIFETYNERNPFPASFTVTFDDLTKVEDIKNQILEFDYVKDITHAEQVMDILVKFTNIIKKFFIIFSLILIFISIVLINNVIKLSINARGKEISIMKYVGATNAFIRWPFIVEGIVLGLLAAIVSIGLMASVYIVCSKNIAKNLIFQTMNVTLIPFEDIILELFIVYIVLGIGIGVIGSSSSMKKYLQV